MIPVTRSKAGTHPADCPCRHGPSEVAQFESRQVFWSMSMKRTSTIPYRGEVADRPDALEGLRLGPW